MRNVVDISRLLFSKKYSGCISIIYSNCNGLSLLCNQGYAPISLLRNQGYATISLLRNQGYATISLLRNQGYATISLMNYLVQPNVQLRKYYSTIWCSHIYSSINTRVELFGTAI